MSSICPNADMQPRSDSPRGGSWYSQPVVWLGIAVFAATLAGCIYLIVVSAEYDDASLPSGHRVFGVPTQQPARAPSDRLP